MRWVLIASLALLSLGCPQTPPPAAAPPSASPTPTAPLTKAALLGTWTDPAKPGFSFEFTGEHFVIESGGTKMPLAYEVVESSPDTITIVTHEELLGTDETRDTRITYRVAGQSLERLATEGVSAGTLRRQTEALVTIDYDLSDLVVYVLSGPAPRIQVSPSGGSGSGSFDFNDDADLDAKGTLRSLLPQVARDAEFELSDKGVLTLTGSEEVHDALRAWVERRREKKDLIGLPTRAD